MMTTKDFVSAGAPFHVSASVDAAPSQVYSAGRRFPSNRSGLINVNAEVTGTAVDTGVETGATVVEGEAGAHLVSKKSAAKMEISFVFMAFLSPIR
jgi:hypothetical protein